jgi:hypothetical protein
MQKASEISIRFLNPDITMYMLMLICNKYLILLMNSEASDGTNVKEETFGSFTRQKRARGLNNG